VSWPLKDQIENDNWSVAYTRIPIWHVLPEVYTPSLRLVADVLEGAYAYIAH
jgi:hypothetical protein